MKHSILKQSFLAASLAVTAIVGGQSLANAEPGTSTVNQTTVPEAVTSEAGQSPIAEVTPATQSASPSPTTEVTTPAAPVTPITAPAPGVTVEPVTTPAVPLPGTVPTSASPLQSQGTDPSPTPAMEQTTPTEAQPTEAQPAPEQRFTTRYKFSYIGIGPNFGVGGGTALGNVSFSAFSKFALTPEFSFRPGIMVEKTVTFLLPATYDFRISGPGQIAPFAGIGAKINTGDSDQFDLLLTGGVDYPINRDLVANATLNIGPLNGFDAGIAIGLAYSFGQETIRTPEKLGGIGNEVGNLFGKNPAKPNHGYLGAGMNFGTGAGGGLGRISGAIYSKLPLSSYFSFRPSFMFANLVSFLLPVTYDFNEIRVNENIRLFPYAGTGVSFSSGNTSQVDWLLSAGIDLPITSNFVATFGINIAPIDTFDFGFLMGVAYSFGKF